RGHSKTSRCTPRLFPQIRAFWQGFAKRAGRVRRRLWLRGHSLSGNTGRSRGLPISHRRTVAVSSYAYRKLSLRLRDSWQGAWGQEGRRMRCLRSAMGPGFSRQYFYLSVGAVAALLAFPTQIARADEGGVSFWLPGFFGSLAAVPAQTPGWSVTS